MENFREQLSKKTDDELVDIFMNAHDYQPEFVKMAEAEIDKRKLPLDSLLKKREAANDTNDAEMKIGKKGSNFWIVVFFILTLLGGIISIIAGYLYAFSSNKNTKGETVYVYDESTRTVGKLLLGVGTLFFVLGILSRIFL